MIRLQKINFYGGKTLKQFPPESALFDRLVLSVPCLEREFAGAEIRQDDR